jgi:hypothetical protein
MNENRWEEIPGFQSHDELARFEQWLSSQIALGFAVELAVQEPYMSCSMLEERWFRHVKTAVDWRLVRPDYPFRGLFKPVNNS